MGRAKESWRESGDQLGAELWGSSHERNPAHGRGRGESKTKATTPSFTRARFVHIPIAGFSPAATARPQQRSGRVRAVDLMSSWSATYEQATTRGIGSSSGRELAATEAGSVTCSEPQQILRPLPAGSGQASGCGLGCWPAGIPAHPRRSPPKLGPGGCGRGE